MASRFRNLAPSPSRGRLVIHGKFAGRGGDWFVALASFVLTARSVEKPHNEKDLVEDIIEVRSVPSLLSLLFFCLLFVRSFLTHPTKDDDDDDDNGDDLDVFRTPSHLQPRSPLKKFRPEDLSSGGGGVGGGGSTPKRIAVDVGAPPYALSEHHEIPGELNALLRGYQRAGVEFLYRQWASDSGAILGDDMGLGKTVQTLALIASVRGKWLILAPLTVLSQWESEAQRYTSLRCAILHGNRDQKRAALAKISGPRADILLTSYETFETLREEECAHMEWSGVVFDELHRLKSGAKTKIYQACKQIACRRKIGLTGTLMQNNMLELFALVDFIEPGVLGTQQGFESKFSRAIKVGLRRDATWTEIASAREASKLLASTLSRVHLRRDKRVLADALPKKDDMVLFCRPTEFQMAVYGRLLESPQIRKLKDSLEPCPCPKSAGKRTRQQCCWADEGLDLGAEILKAISQLRRISNHLYRVIDADTADGVRGAGVFSLLLFCLLLIHVARGSLLNAFCEAATWSACADSTWSTRWNSRASSACWPSCCPSGACAARRCFSFRSRPRC